MTDENNQIKFFLYENWARTKTGQHTVLVVYRYQNSSVAENETVELQMLGYHRSPTKRSKASGGSYVGATA